MKPERTMTDVRPMPKSRPALAVADPGPKRASSDEKPAASTVALLRSALLDSLAPEDITGIVQRLIFDAKGGSIAAAREVLSRALGAPEAIDVLARMEGLEATVAKLRELER